MNVAIVVPRVWDSEAFSTDPRILVQGFEQAGSKATIICGVGSRFPADTAATIVDVSKMASPGYWRHERFDLAVVFTHLHSHQRVVAAAATSGVYVISKGDTSGLYGPRSHPLQTLRFAISSAEGAAEGVRNGWLWTKRLVSRSEYQALARPIVENLRTADCTIVEIATARENLGRFLDGLGESELLDRIHYVPNPVDPAFESMPPSEKQRLIYAVGRWDSRQKNAPLLGATLRRYLDKDREACAVIAGGGAEAVVAAGAIPRTDRIGVVSRKTLADYASTARICLVTSRWEGSHIGAHEALTVGATVVGTPIPAVKAMVAEGPFGETSRAHSTRRLAHALEEEMRAWDEGGRAPGAISAFWKARLAPRAVAAQLLGLPELRHSRL